MKRIIVLYLSSKYTNTINLKNFIKFYKKFSPGIKHELIICFKNLTSKELFKRKKILKKIKHKEFIDPSVKNDHEWGSIGRVSEEFNPSIIFYMNDYSYPIKKNWLRIIASKYKKKRIIGCSGSMSSWATNSYFRNNRDNFLIYFYKYFYFNLFIPKFPNAHLRANGLLFHSSDYLKFIKDKKIETKKNSLVLESGHKSFTNFFKKMKYQILVINSDGKLFDETRWKNSNTFAFKKQEKLLISDKDTRNYLNLDTKLKKKKQIMTWGVS
jgi:glucan-binding YG repeat protein